MVLQNNFWDVWQWSVAHRHLIAMSMLSKFCLASKVAVVSLWMSVCSNSSVFPATAESFWNGIYVLQCQNERPTLISGIATLVEKTELADGLDILKDTEANVDMVVNLHISKVLVIVVIIVKIWNGASLKESPPWSQEQRQKCHQNQEPTNIAHVYFLENCWHTITLAAQAGRPPPLNEG